jgi:hypothetical protein
MLMSWDLLSVLAERVLDPGSAIVTAADDERGPYARFAREIGARFYRAELSPSPGEPHIETQRAYARRRRRWTHRFRGVATRYLSHYLVWHRSVDALKRGAVRAPAGLCWPVGEVFA